MQGVEIERKFLVVDLSPTRQNYLDEDGSSGTSIVQGYLLADEHRQLRVRVTVDQATLTLKGPRKESLRIEYESALPREMGEQLLALCGDRIVSKTRYPVVAEGHLWVIDIFEDCNEGLAIAEIELGSLYEEFRVPGWCGAEVTDDDRYYNHMLAVKPYTRWSS